jgi:hypothetical protein
MDAPASKKFIKEKLRILLDKYCGSTDRIIQHLNKLDDRELNATIFTPGVLARIVEEHGIVVRESPTKASTPTLKTLESEIIYAIEITKNNTKSAPSGEILQTM